MRICPRCQNTNPADAVFCFFDGINLNAAPATVAAPGKADVRLPHDFVLPSGRRCKTFDDLVQACQEEWGTASELLQEGAFRQFLTGAGRLDLAKAADEAKGQPDADLALDTFLGRLPALERKKPRLELEPRRLLLGVVGVGAPLNPKLLVINEGHGLLHGTISISEGGDWLRLAGANDSGTLTIKTVREQVVQLEVNSKNLLAPHKYAASLTIVTNGGIVEIPVRLTTAAHPFPKEPFQGAGTPRDLAVRMRANPKPAVPLLEGGEVARWFEANRWGYPVQGLTAPGMGAVQQFFEAMGLAKPPQVRLIPAEVSFACLPGQALQSEAVIQSPERKWVYAQATSAAPWLHVKTPVASGPQLAVIHYVVDAGQLGQAGMHEGVLRLHVNGGQQLALRVRADVQGAPLPVAVPHRKFRPVLTGMLAGLVARLLLAVPADLVARLWLGTGTDAGSVASWGEAPLAAVFVKHFTLATAWLGALIGAIVLGRRRTHWADVPCGLIAGAATGAAVSATLACLLPGLDALPRRAWLALQLRPLPAGAATAAWLAVAVVSWALLGAVFGLVVGRAGGSAGRRFVQGIGRVVGGLLRGIGLKRVAALVTTV